MHCARVYYWPTTSVGNYWRGQQLHQLLANFPGLACIQISFKWTFCSLQIIATRIKEMQIFALHVFFSRNSYFFSLIFLKHCSLWSFLIYLFDINDFFLSRKKRESADFFKCGRNCRKRNLLAPVCCAAFNSGKQTFLTLEMQVKP